MGNYVYAETLIGMTIPIATKYIKENSVYLGNSTYKITEIRPISPNGIYTKECCPNTLDVTIDQYGIISNIL